jgi:beta-lactamase class A
MSALINPLPSVPSKARSLNPLPTLDLGGGDYSSLHTRPCSGSIRRSARGGERSFPATNREDDVATQSALVAEARLSSIRIPDSTRRFLSYILGAPAGTDLGWPGIANALTNPPGPRRSPLNDVITLAGSASDFVSWYEQALRGTFFAKRESLTEFKRIQAMSAQIAKAVPPDTPAYAKGGELPWPGLSAKSFAGQIVVGGAVRTPVTFCFIVNWNGTVSGFAAVEAEFFAAIKGILRVIKRDLQ